MRRPVNEPGPQANASASRSAGTSSFSARSSRIIGINRRVCPRGARSNRSATLSSISRAAEQPSDEVSSASNFTGLLQLGKNLVANVIQAAHAFYAHIFRRSGRGFFRPVLIVTDQWRGLLVVDLQAFADGFFLVVLALDEGIAGLVVLPSVLGGSYFT